MVGSRWVRRVGPGVLAAVAVVVVATSASGAGAPAAHAWSGQACRGPARAPAAPPGTWYRLDPILDGNGALAGQVLSIGAAARRGPATLDLASESFAGVDRKSSADGQNDESTP